MILRAFALAVVVLAPAVPAAAQEWARYRSTQDAFTVNFPGQPTVTETAWTSEYGFTLPARVYSAARGPEKYSVTAVDYGAIEHQGIERSKKCPAEIEQCIGSDLGGEAHWKHDARGALLYAVFKFLGRGANVTAYNWGMQDRVEGNYLQMTNGDGSRTFVVVAMHEMKLIVLEGTVPPGAPEPALFQQSLGWLDRNGNAIRYDQIYVNQIHGLRQVPPPPTRRGAGLSPYEP